MNEIGTIVAKGIALVVVWVIVQVTTLAGLIEEALKDSLLFAVMVIGLYVAYRELKAKDDKLEDFTERLITADERQAKALKELTKEISDLNKQTSQEREKTVQVLKEEIKNLKEK